MNNLDLEDLIDRACKNGAISPPMPFQLSELVDWLRSLYPELYSPITKMDTTMVDIAKHPLLRECYEVCLAIEQCEASDELTDASGRASDLLDSIDKTLTKPKNSVVITEQLDDLPEWVEKLMAEGCLIDTLVTQHMNMRTALQAIASPHQRLSRKRMIEAAAICLDANS